MLPSIARVPVRPLPLLLLAGLGLASCNKDPVALGEVVVLETRDGVSLEGDYLSASAGRPAVVLLHMKPPDWSRADWPSDFLSTLNDHDWHVLAIDRRGSGGSGGDAVDAYEGEAGRYDVEACVKHLSAEGATDIVIVAASNGTTSLVDYTVWASGEGLPEPEAAVFMTGGTYTENQTTMEAFAAEGIPSAFTFSTAEREWSVEQEALDPGTWSFLEYPEGAHGTKIFEASPEVADDVDAWLVEQLGG